MVAFTSLFRPIRYKIVGFDPNLTPRTHTFTHPKFGEISVMDYYSVRICVCVCACMCVCCVMSAYTVQSTPVCLRCQRVYPLSPLTHHPLPSALSLTITTPLPSHSPSPPVCLRCQRQYKNPDGSPKHLKFPDYPLVIVRNKDKYRGAKEQG